MSKEFCCRMSSSATQSPSKLEKTTQKVKFLMGPISSLFSPLNISEMCCYNLNRTREEADLTICIFPLSQVIRQIDHFFRGKYIKSMCYWCFNDLAIVISLSLIVRELLITSNICLIQYVILTDIRMVYEKKIYYIKIFILPTVFPICQNIYISINMCHVITSSHFALLTSPSTT